MEGKLSLTITTCWELEVHLNPKLIVSVLRDQKRHFAVKTNTRGIRTEIENL
jgi:hypothetical protein